MYCPLHRDQFHSCSSLEQPRCIVYKTQWARQVVKLSRLISIFTSKNVWKFLIKIQLTKSNPKIIRGVNPPCLMPIRVKYIVCFILFFRQLVAAQPRSLVHKKNLPGKNVDLVQIEFSQAVSRTMNRWSDLNSGDNALHHTGRQGCFCYYLAIFKVSTDTDPHVILGTQELSFNQLHCCVHIGEGTRRAELPFQPIRVAAGRYSRTP